MGKYQSSLSLRPSFLSEESLLHAIIVASQGTSDLNAHISKFRGRKSGRLLKLPCLTNVELAVISDLGFLHLSYQSIIDLRPEIMFQVISSCRSLLKQERLRSPRSCIWRNRRLQEGKSPMKEHLPLFLHARFDQISGTTTKEGRIGQERGHPTLKGERTYPVGEVTHA
jgi:hypothetical protein